MDSPPVIKCTSVEISAKFETNLTSGPVDDYLAYGYSESGTYEYGTMYLGFWSMRNNTLHLSSNINYAPPVVQRFNATVWSWIINPNQSASVRRLLLPRN